MKLTKKQQEAQAAQLKIETAIREKVSLVNIAFSTVFASGNYFYYTIHVFPMI